MDFKDSPLRVHDVHITMIGGRGWGKTTAGEDWLRQKRMEDWAAAFRFAILGARVAAGWTVRWSIQNVDPELLRLLRGDDVRMAAWAKAARSAIAEERWRGRS